MADNTTDDTPAGTTPPPDQAALSTRVSLADLCARAAVLYAQQKNYEEAAELYARAAEIQAELNGEMHPDNAEILFLYGRALFKVGQAKSDVLGGKAEETATTTTTKPAAEKPAAGATANAAPTKEEKEAAEAALQGKKPLFQFAGDEEWDQSDEENAENDDNDEEEEEEDDLAVAFEVLDLARVLFEKQLEEKKKDSETTETNGNSTSNGDKGKGKEKVEETETEEKEEEEMEMEDDAPLVPDAALRHVLERLADTHDLLAEISLENERYPNAIVDSRASLAYKKQFLPEASESIAEGHFKLSLALEFASVTQTSEEGAATSTGAQAQQVDQDLRDEAARELEAAIASTRRKLQNKEVELATLHAPEANDATRRQIADVKEIIADMELRLVDLRKPPIDLNAAVNGGAVGSLLGALSGGGGGIGSGSGSVEEAKKAATDLTGLVRKKEKKAGASSSAETNGKRKASVGETEAAKKARTEA